MSTTVFIDGAAGTTGLEIVGRLQDRPEFALLTLDDAKRKDPAARREALNEADIAILCLPDDAAREAVAMIDPASGTRVIDASSAHRTAEGWTYGLPELVGRKAVAGAERVSNPGCYPTGFLALVAPLVRAGLIGADWPYTINAISGVSGGGNALIDRFAREPDIAYRTYGLAGGHKHLPEMQRHAGLAHPPVFAPAVVPAYRGMLVEVPLNLPAMGRSASPQALQAALAEFYSSSPVVSVAGYPFEGSEILLSRDAAPWDGLELFVFGDKPSHVRLAAVLDNLGKGASGAAVQSLNLMTGLDETTGLRLSA